MKMLIKVLTALLAVAGVAYWLISRFRPAHLKLDLEKMEQRAEELYEDKEGLSSDDADSAE